MTDDENLDYLFLALFQKKVQHLEMARKDA